MPAPAKRSDWWLLVAAVLTVVVIICAAGLAIHRSLANWETRGQFGDMFGVVNALFSGLAFAGLIYTVWLQRQELSLQRKELEMTREELARSANAQEKAESALAAQVGHFARQVDIWSRSLREHAGASVAERQIQVDTALLERSHLRPYLWEGKVCDPRDEHHNELLALAQLLSNYFDTYFLQREDFEQLWSGPQWTSYILTHIRNSPTLRAFIMENRPWFTNPLVELVESVSRPDGSNASPQDQPAS